MKSKLGVIGGLGTDTAAQFYIETERFWHDSGETGHIPFMLENVQSPFSLEQSLTKTMDRVNELKEFLVDAAITLEQGGASLVVLPCNTAHVHIEEVRKAVSVHMLSITEEVAHALKASCFETTGVLGTRVTRESGIYDMACRAQNIATLYPSKYDQLVIEKIIQRALSWQNTADDTQSLLTVIEHMKEAGASSVVLACTDLQLCMPKHELPGVFDSMKVLAEASVNELKRQSLRSRT